MPVKDYRDDLLVRLSNPEYSARYLQTALDETLQDGNMGAFLLALKNVVDATETLQENSSRSDISKHHLQQMLVEDDNPTLETLAAVLKAVQLTIEFKPVSA